MKNTGGESLPAEGRNYAGTSINNENPAPPSTHREKVTLLRGSLANAATVPMCRFAQFPDHSLDLRNL